MQFHFRDEGKLNQFLHHEYQISLLNISLDIAEHSKCQPGLPLPQGESQEGSSSLEGFHKTKSSDFFLFSETSTLDPAIKSSNFLFDNFP